MLICSLMLVACGDKKSSEKSDVQNTTNSSSTVSESTGKCFVEPGDFGEKDGKKIIGPMSIPAGTVDWVECNCSEEYKLALHDININSEDMWETLTIDGVSFDKSEFNTTSIDTLANTLAKLHSAGVEMAYLGRSSNEKSFEQELFAMPAETAEDFKNILMFIQESIIYDERVFFERKDNDGDRIVKLHFDFPAGESILDADKFDVYLSVLTKQNNISDCIIWSTFSGIDGMVPLDYDQATFTSSCEFYLVY